ncbi:hypothetical protein [Acidianus brierleyi]|uniref:Uncharacterized protein n=1 Tax=Acidianus brierleyi TaxID=41673 RepID=A0A2U9IGV7_9CREN|nr:hypothetical protein [Acidianus brierleyi]AWR95288.1 hypothetical protein DFR85_12475 [Acidianus brierleyi]
MKPIYAKGIFEMSNSGEVFQNVIFYYKEYSRPKKIRDIKANMQKFLDNEEVFINHKKVKPKVIWINARLMTKNISFIHIFIRFNGQLISGINEYEDIYESETSEYPYEIFWRFPGKIIYVKLNGKVKYVGKLLHAKIRKGTLIEGHDIIRFSIN